MAGYYGTQMQQALQMQAEAAAEWIMATPGACQAGRFMGCDDPGRLGWDRINEYLDRDGLCGFRLISAAQSDEVRARLAAQDFRFDTWDVFVGERGTALVMSEEILSRGLPDGITEMPTPTDPESEDMQRIQALMDAVGVVPFSGSMLAGIHGPATTTALGDQDGNVVAVAHGDMPHNTHSGYHRYAWGGLVAVAEAARGRGLGAFVNARMTVGVFRDLGATHIYELVSATNIPSRRMVESCGLRHEPGLLCGLATPHVSKRFTR
jgi:RimJ/RimL family protein N-acetyltransferase